MRAGDVVVICLDEECGGRLQRLMRACYRQPPAVATTPGHARRNPRQSSTPTIVYTCDENITVYSRNDRSKADYYDKKVVLLLRHPADVALTRYRLWKMDRPATEARQPARQGLSDDASLFDFIMQPDCGVIRAIEQMNGWAREMGRFRSILPVAYEDLNTHPESSLARILQFVGTPKSASEIRDALAVAAEGPAGLPSLPPRRRVAPHWPTTARSVHAGGGPLYREHLSPDQCAHVDDIVATWLSPVFRYGSARSRTVSGGERRYG